MSRKDNMLKDYYARRAEIEGINRLGVTKEELELAKKREAELL